MNGSWKDMNPGRIYVYCIPTKYLCQPMDNDQAGIFVFFKFVIIVRIRALFSPQIIIRVRVGNTRVNTGSGFFGVY